MQWFYLFIAAVFETAWTFSLKFLEFRNIKLLRWDNFLKMSGGLPIFAPLLGYIVFGIGNIYFISLAMKQIPMAMAVAIWMSMSLVFIKGAEMIFFHQRISIAEVFFISLIIVGIVGLKVYSTNN